MHVDGNDAIASYQALQQAMEYVRTERRPLVLEAAVSRLHGHSSSSGANRVTDETDCLAEFEAKLIAAELLTRQEADALYSDVTQRLADEARRVVKEEPKPEPSTIHDHVYADSNVVAES